MKFPSPIRLMWFLFIGFAVSLAYGLCSASVVYWVTGKTEAQKYLVMFIGSFNTLMNLGLISGTTLIVRAAQNIIPDTIEAAFPEKGELPDEYRDNRERFVSHKRTITFASELIVMGFIIFHFCHFPLSNVAEGFMLVAACAQWGLASYVGRKLRYAGMMLHSLLQVEVRRNLFKGRELDSINTAVNVASTLTIVFVYLHVRSYYGGPFLYDTFLGKSAQVFLLLPAVLATPVLLIFNFFPREVLRKIYSKSIEIEVSNLHEELKTEALSEFEKKLRLMDLGKMYREELRYSLQLTLSDLPIGVTILIMVIEPLFKR